jgi:hypothetical protein
MNRFVKLSSISLGICLLQAACSPQTSTKSVPGATPGFETAPQTAPSAAALPEEDGEYRIITLLPRDAIPAIDAPLFLTAEQAEQEYAPDEQVLGVVFDGDARAYSVPLLSVHEIVNDTVAGRKIAVTW